MLFGNALSIVVLEILEKAFYMLSKTHKIAYKKLTAVALNIVAIALLCSYRLYLKRLVHSIRAEILTRILMCKTLIVIISSASSFIDGASPIGYSVYIVLCFITYIIRVCFYEYVKQNFKRRMLGGMSGEIIWLEKYVLATKNYGGKKRKGSYEQTAESFYRLGYPEPLDADYFFQHWNDRAEVPSLYDSEHDNFIVEMESSNFSADYLLLPNSEDTGADVQAKDTKNGNSTVSNKTNTQHRGKNLEEQDVHRYKKVTVSSLQRYFSEKNACEVFRIISFDRDSELTYKMFNENIKQINNERLSLYKSIDDFYELMFRVKLGAVLLQTVSCVSLLFLLLETGTFVTMLCLPFFLFLLLPSLERVSSSILFILVSNPFNSGDRIFLDDENMVVRKIALLSTTLDRWNGEQVVVSNQKIAHSTIHNIMRSNSQQWRLDLVVPSSTGREKVDFLRSSLKRFASVEKVFLAVSMTCFEIVDSRFLRISIIVKHKRNYQNGFFTWVNHNKFMRRLILLLKELDIKYLPMEVPIEIENGHNVSA